MLIGCRPLPWHRRKAGAGPRMGKTPSVGVGDGFGTPVDTFLGLDEFICVSQCYKFLQREATYARAHAQVENELK